MKLTTVGCILVLGIVLLVSFVANATCSTSCENAIPILDQEACTPPPSIDPCENQDEDCESLPSELIYDWPASQPFQVSLSCITTCCAPDQEDDYTCSEEPAGLPYPSEVSLLDINSNPLETSFKQAEVCGGTILMDHSFETTGYYRFVHLGFVLLTINVFQDEEDSDPPNNQPNGNNAGNSDASELTAGDENTDPPNNQSNSNNAGNSDTSELAADEDNETGCRIGFGYTHTSRLGSWFMSILCTLGFLIRRRAVHP